LDQDAWGAGADVVVLDLNDFIEVDHYAMALP